MSNIKIVFSAPSPVPSLGYVVKYREVGTTTWSTVSPNPTASPVYISVPDGKNWEGTIASQCDGSTLSSEEVWSIDDTLTCKTYRITGSPDVVGSGDVSYVDCDGITAATGVVANQIIYMCGRAGTLINEQPDEVLIEEVGVGCGLALFDTGEYSLETDSLQAACNFPSTTVTRSTDASDDSISLNIRVIYRIRFFSDGAIPGGDVYKDYIFEIGATEANEHHEVNLDSGGACTNIFYDLPIILVA